MKVGGAPTNPTYNNRRNLIHYETLPFGTVTLTDLFRGYSSEPETRADKIEEFIGEQLEKISWLDSVEPDTNFVGVGGAFRNLGRISRLVRKYPFNMTHGYESPAREFDSIYATIRKLDLDSTMKIKGLSSGRADIFPSSLAVIKAVVKKFGFQRITISDCGLREGAMFRYAVPAVHERPPTDVLGHALPTQMTHSDCPLKHT